MSVVVATLSILGVVGTDVAVADRVIAKLGSRQCVAQVMVRSRLCRDVTSVRTYAKVESVVILHSQNVLLNYAALFGARRLLAVSSDASGPAG